MKNLFSLSSEGKGFLEIGHFLLTISRVVYRVHHSHVPKEEVLTSSSFTPVYCPYPLAEAEHITQEIEISDSDIENAISFKIARCSLHA